MSGVEHSHGTGGSWSLTQWRVPGCPACNPVPSNEVEWRTTGCDVPRGLHRQWCSGHSEVRANPVVISLCDLTGNFVRPWVEAGYDAILVDPQHLRSSTHGRVTKIAGTIEEALPELGDVIRSRRIAFVAGFPPCTDMAVSGARWFEAKRKADPMFQAKAVAVAEQCRTLGRLSGAPWLVENPVSVLSRAFGKPDHTFHPADYTAWEPADNYTKKTCLWTGGGFVMPEPQRDPEMGAPDNRIHFASPGPERANFRSATPMGFARAVFEANRERVEAVA